MTGDAHSTQEELYHTGLKNAHALESQAVQILSRQVERLQHYPEMEARLRQHIDESKAQATRLEEILHRHGTDSSAVKDAVTGLMGNLAALGHMPMQDEILKNTFANYAFEHMEIAAYKSLITMAEAAGDTASVPALTQSLSEEIATAQFIETQIAPTTLRYMQLTSAGETAGV